MSCLLKANAYHVLGLDTLASEKEILKRSKEIINRLKIDDCPEYALDLNEAKEFRTEDSVKEALRLLQSPKKHIREFFFWYRIGDAVDEQAAALLKQKKYSEAIDVWQEAAKPETAKAYLYRKNLAVLFCSLLCLENNKEYLDKSLRLWKSIFDSDKFWSAFSKLYKLHNEQTASDEIIREFKTNATEYLSDVYAELHAFYNDTNFIQGFRQTFSATGAVVEKKVLNPVYQAIHGAVERLEAMKVSADGKLDQSETEEIKDSISHIQIELNKLIDLGLFEDSQTRIMRDRAANAIRTVVLDLHNNLSETSKATALLNIAHKIAGTTGLATKIKQEITILEEDKKNVDILKPISDLLKAEQYERAWELIKTERQKHKNNPDLQEFYKTQAKLCVSVLAMQKAKRAHDYFGNKQEDSAKLLFIDAGRLIYENIELFSFDKAAIDRIIAEVKANVAKATTQNLTQFDDYRSSFIKVAKENFEGQFEETILVTLVDSFLFAGLADFMKKTRAKMEVVTALNVLGWLTIWIYGLGLIFWIAAGIYKNTD